MPSPPKPSRARATRHLHAAPPPPSAPPPAPARSHRSIGAVIALAVASWMFLRALSRPQTGPTRAVESRLDRPPGPRAPDGPAWAGELVTRDIAVPLPAEHIHPNECITSLEPWIFNGADLEGVSRLARAAGVAEGDVARMRANSRCDGSGCIVAPDGALVGALSPDARNALYHELYRFPENRLHAFPARRPKALGRWGDDPRISPRVRSLIGRATWELRSEYAFSDIAWLCAQLPTEGERGEALAALYARNGLDVSVRVPRAGDLEPMVRYWSVGGDPGEVRATLEASRGGTVPLASLLPVMARARLDRFPRPTDLEYDCFWTATHFFAGPEPGDDFPGNDGIARVLRTAYVEVPMAEARLGDVIAFSTSTGAVIHTANLIAGDVLFTKNGLSRAQAWLLMRLADVQQFYRAATLRAYRLR